MHSTTDRGNRDRVIVRNCRYCLAAPRLQPKQEQATSRQVQEQTPIKG